MRLRRSSWIATALVVVACALPAAAHAQQTPTPPATAPPLRIFLDCYQCDTEYMRQNILFIDYMRDRNDADLHVLVTTQSTGSGGTAWTVKFIGLGRFQAQDRTLTFSTSQTATSDDQRKEFSRVFRLGLAGYAADTAVARDLVLTYKPPATQSATPVAKSDPWNKWVFRTSGNANVNGEASSKYKSYRLSFSGNRVTENWKINLSTSTSDSNNTFTLSDGRTIESRSDSWNVYGVAVKSMGPRFSVGARLSASHSSFSNQDRSISFYPGFEFDVFPYADYERRSFSIWYEIGPNFYDYRQMTIFDKLKEQVPKQQLTVAVGLRQPWGSLNASTNFSQHLNSPDRYSISTYGSTDVSLFKGFSFNMFGEYSKIKDQIGLPKAGASQDEILLHLQQLKTNYSYFFAIGFSYSFGSIFNSVVNPRFNGANFFF